MIHDAPEGPAETAPGHAPGRVAEEDVARDVDAPLDRDAMVGLMRRYRRATREEVEANGAA